MPSNPAGAIDKRIGQNIRDSRLAAKLSQQKLAEVLGVSFQQVEKYEKGVNRCPAASLYLIAVTTGVHVGDLFAGLGQPPRSP